MRYHNITYPDMNNGDGLRVVLWLSGCNHHCAKCQNPQTWNPDSGILFDKNAENELIEELKRDYISGLTLSGGDPLHENNLEEVLNLVNKIRLSLPEKTIWLYTGYTWEQIMKYEFGSKYIKSPDGGYWNCDALRQIIVSKCDILVDGRYIENQRDITLKWRGSSNQRVIDIRRSITNNKIILYTQ